MADKKENMVSRSAAMLRMSHGRKLAFTALENRKDGALRLV
ncbi:MAG TPA: hypothetical protein PL100_08100 [Bacillota bacterium]|nr:hypothetical protein [Bacillota bacterium]